MAMVEMIFLKKLLLISIGGCFAGSVVTGPIRNERADLWPRIASAANAAVKCYFSFPFFVLVYYYNFVALF